MAKFDVGYIEQELINCVNAFIFIGDQCNLSKIDINKKKTSTYI